VGRTYRDAPEVDGLVIIDGLAPIGEIVPVKITGAMEYDLEGTVEMDEGRKIKDEKDIMLFNL
jgi:hypothetical protein